MNLKKYNSKLIGVLEGQKCWNAGRMTRKYLDDVWTWLRSPPFDFSSMQNDPVFTMTFGGSAEVSIVIHAVLWFSCCIDFIPYLSTFLTM
jgi:hypothetical protein